MMPSEAAQKNKERWHALDIFRGIAVLGLIIFNGFYGFTNAPKWLTHAEQGGYRFPDVIAPLFLFSVGMALSISLKKRFEQYGLRSTVKHILFRGLLLISFGLIGDFLCFRDLSLHWGTLEMIGGCVLISAPTIIYLSPWKRIAAGFGIIIAWFFINALSDKLHFHVIRLDMGGPGAVIAWSSIVIIGSAISDFFTQSKTSYLAKQLTLLTGLASGYIFFSFYLKNILPNKALVNSPYLALSTTLACALLLLVTKFQNSRMMQIIFTPYGRNAMAMYMISGILNQLLQTALPTDTPLGQMMPYSILLILTASGIIFWLYRKNKIITL